MIKPTTVEEYINLIPENVKNGFIALHETILKAAPGAASVISYSMPAIKKDGIVVYYANWEKHYAIYPMPSAMKVFVEKISAFVTSKSTIQFPHGKPMPKQLIIEIVKFRLDENVKKAALKKRK